MEKKTNEDKAFHVLAFEFRGNSIEENNKKIRRNIGAKVFDSLPDDWLPNLRALKNSLLTEISKFERSKYHNGKKDKYADMSHFEIEKMVTDYCELFPSIDKKLIEGFIPYAIYLYYLR